MAKVKLGLMQGGAPVTHERSAGAAQFMAGEVGAIDLSTCARHPFRYRISAVDAAFAVIEERTTKRRHSTGVTGAQCINRRSRLIFQVNHPRSVSFSSNGEVDLSVLLHDIRVLEPPQLSDPQATQDH